MNDVNRAQADMTAAQTSPTVDEAWNRVRDEARSLGVSRGLGDLLTATDALGDARVAEAHATLSARIAELEEALLKCARMAEALKQPCSMDPESAQAVRNSQYMDISYFARATLSKGTQA